MNPVTRKTGRPCLFPWKRTLLLSALIPPLMVAFVDDDAQGQPAAKAEPIIIEGRYLDGFVGLPCNALALSRIQDQELRPLPFQIDRRVCTSEGTDETCTYVLDGDSDRYGSRTEPFGARDELVFLASEAGECAGPDEGIESAEALTPFAGEGVIEIRIESQKRGARSCVYLHRNETGNRDEFPPAIAYDPALDAVASSTYSVAFDPENPYFWKTISLSREGRPIPLLTEEGVFSRVSHAKGMVVYEVVRNDIRSTLVGHRAGPVRILRVTRNRLRVGPFLWKESLETGIYYGDRFHTSFHSGTYFHRRLLVEERQRLFTNLAPEAVGWEWLGQEGRILGLVDGRVSPEEETAPDDGLQAMILAGEAGSLLYRVWPCTNGRKEKPLFFQPYLHERDGPPASAGICIPNLQDSQEPRQRFVKSLFFFPSHRAGDDDEAPVPDYRPAELRVWAGPREVPQPVHPPWPSACAAEGSEERRLRQACLRPEPREGEDRRWGVVPILSAGPDRGLGFGVKYSNLGLLRPDQPMQARVLYTIYQYTIAEFWYSINAFPTRRSGLRLTCNFYDKTRARFYGIGNDKAESDVAGFGWQDLDLSVVLDHKLPHHLGLLVGWGSRWGGIGDDKADDYPNLKDLYPGLFGLQGGWANGPLLGLYRSTLSPPGDPLCGGTQAFTVSLSDDGIGTYTYQRYRLQAVQVIPLPAYAHRLALRGQIQLMGGTPPFYLLSWVGGDDTARGYYEGRYRDLDRILLNVEYRCNLYKFLDGVLFLDTGRVVPDLFRTSLLEDLRLTGGAGLRIHLPPDLVVRFDVGISSEMAAAYFNFGHAF